MVVVRVATPEELPRCLEVRNEVFVVGQGVPEADEIDGLDPECVHLLVLDGDEAIGAARLRDTEGGRAKLERVAIRAPWRGRGLGKRLMEALESEAWRRGLRDAVLAAQVEVIPFYEALGWTARGDVFVDAGIDHRWMDKRLMPPG